MKALIISLAVPSAILIGIGLATVATEGARIYYWVKR